jgi:hypothetical protein
VVANLVPATSAQNALARVTAVRLGRYRRPFNVDREADWIAEAVDLGTVDTVLSGAGGWPTLDPLFESVFAALSKRASRPLEHQTYKHRCGEFYAASAFGFVCAVERVRQGSRGVLLYTLGMNGAKALCCVQP